MQPEKMVELVSSVQEKNIENEDTIQELQQRLSDMEDLLQSKKMELGIWEKKHQKMEKMNYELIERMATKTLEQTQSLGGTSHRLEIQARSNGTDMMN